MAKWESEEHFLSDDIHIISKDDGSSTRRFTERDEAEAYYEQLKREEVQDRIASTNERILEILEGKKSPSDISYDSSDDDSEYEKRIAEKAEKERIAKFEKYKLAKYETLIINGQRNNIPWNDVALTTSNPTVIHVLEGLKDKNIYLSLSSNTHFSRFKRGRYWDKYYKMEEIEENGYFSYFFDGCFSRLVGIIVSFVIGVAGNFILNIVFSIFGFPIPPVSILVIAGIVWIYQLYVNYIKYN